MSSPKMPTCSTCPYWLDNRAEPDDRGQCVLLPPVPFSEDLGPNVRPITDWRQPETDADTTCGQHPAFKAYLAARERWPES